MAVKLIQLTDMRINIFQNLYKIFVLRFYYGVEVIKELNWKLLIRVADYL